MKGVKFEARTLTSRCYRKTCLHIVLVLGLSRGFRIEPLKWQGIYWEMHEEPLVPRLFGLSTELKVRSETVERKFAKQAVWNNEDRHVQVLELLHNFQDRHRQVLLSLLPFPLLLPDREDELVALRC